MGEFGNNNSYNSAEQLPPTAPNYLPESNGQKFYDYIQPASNAKSKMLQGGVVEYETKPSMQLQNGVTETQTTKYVPLRANIQDSQLRANVQDNGGIPTTCLRIEDQNHLDRDVFRSPFTGQVYHNVFIKESDYAVVQRARATGSMEQVNLYDKTGHLIQPVYAAACGGLFSVNYQPSTVVLNLYESPGMNNQQTYQSANRRGSAAIPESLKQKYEKAKPFVQGLLRQLRSF